MRILVLGCGGIGGTIAAGLTRAGADVTPVTGNAAVAEALARDGYQVEDFEGARWSVPVARAPRVALPAIASAAMGASSGDGERFDLCVVATPATRLEEALASALPHLADGAPVVCCQNGLPEERAARVVGASRVVGCVVGWGATMVAPGSYRRTSAATGVLTLGRPAGAKGGDRGIGAPTDGAPTDAGLAEVAALLALASPVRVVDDLAAVRWSKLAINCVTSTIGAVGGNRLGALMRHRLVRRIALEVFAEVAAVARAEGVRPAPVSGTLDIARIAITDAERSQRVGSTSLAYKHGILLAVGLKFRRMRSSMLYALERGRTPDIEHLNGEVVRRGEAHGVEVPVNRALVHAVRWLVAERERPSGGRPSLELLRAIHEQVVLTLPAASLAA